MSKNIDSLIARFAPIVEEADAIAAKPAPFRADVQRIVAIEMEARVIDRANGDDVSWADSQEYVTRADAIIHRLMDQRSQIGRACEAADEERLIRRTTVPIDGGRLIVSVHPDHARLTFDEDGAPQLRHEYLTTDQAAQLAAALTLDD